MTTLAVCPPETGHPLAETLEFQQTPSLFEACDRPSGVASDSVVQSENALLESLVARRRQAIEESEAAFRTKLQSERDAERQRLNDVLARVLDRHGVRAAG